MLGAAGKILEKEGPAGLSVREAARRAGVSHNAPYRHFPEREALLAALAQEGFAWLQKSLENRAGRELGEAYVHFALEHPQRVRLMCGGALPMETYPELQQHARATFARLQSAFAGLGTEAEFAAAAAWSLVHGLAQLILDGHFERGEAFVRKVLGAMRFAATAQRSA